MGNRSNLLLVFAFYCMEGIAASACLVLERSWDIESRPTIRVYNVARMVAARKPVVLFSGMTRSFITLRSPETLAAVLSSCPADVCRRLDVYLSSLLSNAVWRSGSGMELNSVRRNHMPAILTIDNTNAIR